MPIIFEYEKFDTKLNNKFSDFEKFINEIDYRIEKNIDNTNFLILPK